MREDVAERVVKRRMAGYVSVVHFVPKNHLNLRIQVPQVIMVGKNSLYRYILSVSNSGAMDL